MANLEYADAWKDFGSLAKFELAFYGTPNEREVEIYANSKNQVAVIVTIELLDKNGDKLSVSDDEIEKLLFFCDYKNGARLNENWIVSNESGEYLIGSADRSQTPPGKTRYLYRYISCAKHDENQIDERIGVGLAVGKVGIGKENEAYTTCERGSDVNGHHYDFQNSCRITAKRPINYGINENIVMTGTELVTIKDNIKWTSRVYVLAPIYKEHWDGKCKRRIIEIRPNKNKTGIERFKKYDISYDTVSMTEAAVGTDIHWDGRAQPGYDLVSWWCPSYPGAVIGRRQNGGFAVNCWFSRQREIKVYGRFFNQDNSYTYVFNAEMSKILEVNHVGDDEDGAATLLLYQFILPVDSDKYGWKDVINKFTVNVTDVYGNDGTFQLSFDNGKFFEEPFLV